jgi:hypothetical protein
MPIQMVGRLLDHSQIQTTMRYAHLADDPVKQAGNENAERLSALMGGNASSVHSTYHRLEPRLVYTGTLLRWPVANAENHPRAAVSVLILCCNTGCVRAH